MISVYVEDGQACMEEIFLQIGCRIAKHLLQADVAVLIGGADIDPSWYKKERHPTTGGRIKRDQQSVSIYNNAWGMGIPIIGICRGAQLINALSGGDMYQDVNSHGHRHHVYDRVSKCYHAVNSIHHQMMIPTDKAVLIAHAVRDFEGPFKDMPVAAYRERMEGNKIVHYRGGSRVGGAVLSRG